MYGSLVGVLCAGCLTAGLAVSTAKMASTQHQAAASINLKEEAELALKSAELGLQDGVAITTHGENCTVAVGEYDSNTYSRMATATCSDNVAPDPVSVTRALPCASCQQATEPEPTT